MTMLHLSILRFEETATRELLSMVGEHGIIDGVDVNGRPPLHYAAASGQYQLVELLLQHKAMCDMQAMDGTTALHLAVSLPGDAYGVVVRLLLNSKADPLAASAELSTPYHCAARHDRKKTLDQLLAHPAVRSSWRGPRIQLARILPARILRILLAPASPCLRSPSATLPRPMWGCAAWTARA